jgi:Domain of unknown function (DUF4157)
MVAAERTKAPTGVPSRSRSPARSDFHAASPGVASLVGNQQMLRSLGVHSGAAPTRPLAISARTPLGTVQREYACGGEEPCGCHKQSPALPWIQRKAGDGGAAASPNRSLASAALSEQGPGRPLDASSRAFMESRFGRNFGSVRIHTDAAAARASRMMSAEAFTVGGDIHFAEGRYRPDTLPGRRLLAHELTHTVQQGGASTGAIARSSDAISHPHDASEREAESVADRVAAGSPVATGIARSPAMIQRDANDDPSILDKITGAATSVIQEVGSAVGGAAQTVESAVSTGVEAVGSAVSSIPSAVAGAVQSVGTAVSTGVGAVGGVVSSAGSAVGGFLLDQANALAARFGGSVVITPEGIVITFDDIEIAAAEAESHVLPVGIPTETLFEAPFEVGDFVINAWVGTVVGDPEVTLVNGPISLRNIRLVLDPIAGNYSGSGELYVGFAALGSVERATEARLQADGFIPFDPPIPVDASAAVGFRTIWRLVGKAGFRESVAVGYSGGAFRLHIDENLQLGALLQEDHEGFLRIEIETEEICSLIWPRDSDSTRIAEVGIVINRPLTVASRSDGWGIEFGPPTVSPIPVDAIETNLQGDHAPEHCMDLKELAGFLCERGILPPSVCQVLCEQGVLSATECRTLGGGGGGGVAPPGGGGGGGSGDPCSEANMDAKIGSRTVEQIVKQSKLGDKIGIKGRVRPVKPNQDTVTRTGTGSVCNFASRACKGSPFPAIDIYPGKDYYVIDEGHHRFVASRLIDNAVGVSGTHRPPPEPYDPDSENFPNPFEWSEVEWT